MLEYKLCLYCINISTQTVNYHTDRPCIAYRVGFLLLSYFLSSVYKDKFYIPDWTHK